MCIWYGVMIFIKRFVTLIIVKLKNELHLYLMFQYTVQVNVFGGELFTESCICYWVRETYTW